MNIKELERDKYYEDLKSMGGMVFDKYESPSSVYELELFYAGEYPHGDSYHYDLTRKHYMINKNLILLLVVFIFSCDQGRENHSTETTLKNKLETIDSGSHAQADSALKFINGYVENCNRMNEAIGIIDWVNGNHQTTNKFKVELAKIINDPNGNDSESGLGFDPIFNAQDYPETGFELERYDDRNNILIIQGKDWHEFKLSMKIKKDGNQWLVDGCGIVNISKNDQFER